MPVGVKHLVQCHCVLPQFRKMTNPIFHMFTVFSVINDDMSVIPKVAECNNCGAIHNVTEIGKSEIAVGKDDSRTVIRQEDVEFSLSEGLRKVLKSNNADIATWEEVIFAITNNQFGVEVILTRERRGDQVSGKLLRITGESTFRVEQYTRETNRDV